MDMPVTTAIRTYPVSLAMVGLPALILTPIFRMSSISILTIRVSTRLMIAVTVTMVFLSAA